MQRFVPVTSFEHDTHAVLAVDADGSVPLINRAARHLLGMGPTGAAPTQCWKVFAFRTPDGAAFCGPDCPVQRDARTGVPSAQHWVVATRGPSAGRIMELVTFTCRNGGTMRVHVLHFLRPVASKPSLRESAERAIVNRRLAPAFGLTRREGEVLKQLADGLTTTAAARRLGISTTTVRNHIQSIFRKLGVHRRIEAVVAFGRAVSAACGGSEKPKEEA